MDTLQTANPHNLKSREYWIYELTLIDAEINDPKTGPEGLRAAWDDRVFCCKQLQAFDN